MITVDTWWSTTLCHNHGLQSPKRACPPSIVFDFRAYFSLSVFHCNNTKVFFLSLRLSLEDGAPHFAVPSRIRILNQINCTRNSLFLSLFLLLFSNQYKSTMKSSIVLTILLRIIKNALCRLISPLQISGNSRDSSADIRSCVRRLWAAASSKPC